MEKNAVPVSLARYRGEVLETGQAVAVNVPRRRKRRRGWRDQVSLVDMGVMTRLELSGLEARVLFAMLAAVPEKGGATAYITQQEIANRLGVHQPSVARTMKALHERNIVWPLPQRGRWQINSWLAYNGDFDSWNAEAEQDPEPVWVRGVDVNTGEVK